MRSAIIVYDSKFGNTMKLAKCIARGLEERGALTSVRSVGEISGEELRDYDAVVVGGPTHKHGASEGIKAFLRTVPSRSLRGKIGFAFDTKVEHRLSGSAAKVIAGRLRRAGLSMSPILSTIVEGREGPLREGTEELGEKAGQELADRMLREG